MPLVKRPTITQGTGTDSPVLTGNAAIECKMTRENASICPVCDEKFPVECDLQIHLQNHSKREIIEELMTFNNLYTSSAASAPEKVTSQLPILSLNAKKPKRKETGAKPHRLHICSICSLLCSDATSLAVHVAKHGEIYNTIDGGTEMESQIDRLSRTSRAEMDEAKNKMDGDEHHFGDKAEVIIENVGDVTDVIIKTEVPDSYYDGMDSENQETEQFAQNMDNNASFVVKTEVPEFSAEIGELGRELDPRKQLENVEGCNTSLAAGNFSGHHSAVADFSEHQSVRRNEDFVGHFDSERFYAGSNAKSETEGEELVKCEICEMEFMDPADLHIHNADSHMESFVRNCDVSTKTIAEKDTDDIVHSQSMEMESEEPGVSNAIGIGCIIKTEKGDEVDDNAEEGELDSWALDYVRNGGRDLKEMKTPAKKKRGRPKSSNFVSNGGRGLKEMETISNAPPVEKKKRGRPKSMLPKKVYQRKVSKTIMLPPGVKPEIYVVPANSEFPLIPVGIVPKNSHDTSKLNIFTPKEGLLYTCHVCKKAFASVTDLRFHMYGHPGEKLFKCDQCGESFNHAVHHRDHILSKHGENQTVKCKLCDKQFSDVNHLRLHMYLHTGGAPYSCNECGQGFMNTYRLKLHKETHSETYDPLECRHCKKKCKTKTELVHHMADHTGAQKLQCTICNKALINSSNLKMHMLKHSGERPFKCTKCVKTFRSKYQLKRHMVKHTAGGVKEIMCGVCKDVFAKDSALNDHMLACHDIVRKSTLQCTICNKVLLNSSNLKMHMLKHSGERPFKCTKCVKTFRSKYQLKQHHMVKHTMCELCKEVFTKDSALNYHMLACHDIVRTCTLVKRMKVLDAETATTDGDIDVDDGDVDDGDDVDGDDGARPVDSDSKDQLEGTTDEEDQTDNSEASDGDDSVDMETVTVKIETDSDL